MSFLELGYATVLVIDRRYRCARGGYRHSRMAELLPVPSGVFRPDDPDNRTDIGRGPSPGTGAKP
jgi:hypothetical protein